MFVCLLLWQRVLLYYLHRYLFTSSMSRCHHDTMSLRWSANRGCFIHHGDLKSDPKIESHFSLLLIPNSNIRTLKSSSSSRCFDVVTFAVEGWSLILSTVPTYRSMYSGSTPVAYYMYTHSSKLLQDNNIEIKRRRGLARSTNGCFGPPPLTSHACHRVKFLLVINSQHFSTLLFGRSYKQVSLYYYLLDLNTA